MDEFEKLTKMIDGLFKTKINTTLLENVTDSRVKNLIKLLNEYGIYGTKAIVFLQKMSVVCAEDGDTDV